MTDPFRFEKLTAQNRNLVTKLQKLLLRERELIDNQRQIDALFDNAPVELYLKDREGRYLRINKQFEKIFGVKNSDLIGKLPTDVHNPELAKVTRILDLAVLSSGQLQHSEHKVLLVTYHRIHTLPTINFPVFDVT